MTEVLPYELPVNAMNWYLYSSIRLPDPRKFVCVHWVDAVPLWTPRLQWRLGWGRTVSQKARAKRQRRLDRNSNTRLRKRKGELARRVKVKKV